MFLRKDCCSSGDIASNIMFGNPEGGGQEMKAAAQIAQATEFIEAKLNKYESPISQGGSNVSGGQKTETFIAGAIAKRPEVFIFDDSFSALDFKTDVALTESFEKADERKYGADRGTANQYDFKCRTDHCT